MAERSDKGKEKDLSELHVRLNTKEEKDLYLLARQWDQAVKDVQQVSVFKDKDGNVKQVKRVCREGVRRGVDECVKLGRNE